MTAALVDLTARRARGEQAVARMAAAPVRHVPAAFVLALTCLDAAERADRWTDKARRLAR